MDNYNCASVVEAKFSFHYKQFASELTNLFISLTLLGKKPLSAKVNLFLVRAEDSSIRSIF